MNLEKLSTLTSKDNVLSLTEQINRACEHVLIRNRLVIFQYLLPLFHNLMSHWHKARDSSLSKIASMENLYEDSISSTLSC